jgi:protein disulfide-isomerase A6
MYFGYDKKKPIVYKAVKESADIAEWAIENLVNDVEKRIKGDKAGKSKKKFAKPGPVDDTPTDVVTLNSSNWEKTLIKSEDIWLVEFFAPWCGHCKALEPKWRKAAEKLKGNITLAKIDCEENKPTCEKYSVSSYPTIKVFG